jgi:DNA-binding transcriptional regulator of glucitol operon
MWFTRRALLLHLTLVIVFPTFLGLFWWQVQRVRQGNTLSWAYVFEWPFFAGYAVYLWWQLVHDQPDRDSPEVTSPGPVARDGGTPVHGISAMRAARREKALERDRLADQEMEEYNRYLASLDSGKGPRGD